MSRTKQWPRKSSLVAAAFALTAAGAALADDNSMSVWTGESYAYFNNLDYGLGRFNTARAPRNDEQVATGMHFRATRLRLERPPVAASPAPARGTRTNPFRDDTGQ